ncbi:protein-S-isoprenylcysteine O-methyltransferase Ste14 [Sphingomonas vulcanisoli]|uniref:Protein-S-isoprenylcysteine O-methyltransferase Ste14 n=1 Tax=Sphingomonas vulcanisoli TaxID=1658060 RepID=A0ABX0TUH7_9SPHN|nr:isoprenylcysteine carboxylmethyltransferase family protein [Sphingomonas vulcanisoli]NIJ08688.1 protein-S-isoprenylcysteine O-methyltransferase Ste14 [Sphingomonas vulcanisoli]
MTPAGPMPDWLFAILMIWLAWGAVWLAAWFWTNRTTGSAGDSKQAPYRIVNLIGWIALFGDGVFQRQGGVFVWHFILPPLWQLPNAIGWAMAVLAALGIALAFWARATLGRLWSAAVTRKEGHRIVDSGPYALTRHPIYTAILTGAFALAVAKGTPISLAGFVVMVTGYTLKARVEEGFLARELGAAAYSDYRRRVPMLVPFAPAARS